MSKKASLTLVKVFVGALVFLSGCSGPTKHGLTFDERQALYYRVMGDPAFVWPVSDGRPYSFGSFARYDSPHKLVRKTPSPFQILQQSWMFERVAREFGIPEKKSEKVIRAVIEEAVEQEWLSWKFDSDTHRAS